MKKLTNIELAILRLATLNNKATKVAVQYLKEGKLDNLNFSNMLWNDESINKIQDLNNENYQ